MCWIISKLIFYINLIIQWNSSTFLAYRTESKRIKLNMSSRDPNFFDVSMNISMFFRVRFRWIFRCFFEFGSIEQNSKKHRNIEKIWFGSIQFDLVRFGSFRYFRKVLEFHCKDVDEQILTLWSRYFGYVELQ